VYTHRGPKVCQPTLEVLGNLLTELVLSVYVILTYGSQSLILKCKFQPLLPETREAKAPVPDEIELKPLGDSTELFVPETCLH
jgi:hypothetical protein